jgi:glucosamine 6-phosphate synthetase-like amidotransferase/phosphosugar isomerase protein
MCTIVGAAGKVPPKLQAEFHDFMSALFTTAEQRGRDASGFAVWRGDHLVSERRPIPAQDLIQRSNKWRGLIYNPGELYICHTRAATEGDPNDIVNNHPHFGRFMVMVHNGGIRTCDKIVRENKLSLTTDCDSEILLRLIEQKSNSHAGMKHLFEIMEKPGNGGGYAVACIDRRNPTEILLAREHTKPLYVFPCKKFNVTFFASTVAVFEDAVKYMYGTSAWRTSFVEKDEKVDVFHLYALKNDGTYTKEKIYESTSSYGGWHGGSGPYYPTRNKSLKRLVSGYSMRIAAPNEKEFDYDIRGNLTEIVATTGETGSENNIYGDIEVMPEKIEQRLVEFCRNAADWD